MKQVICISWGTKYGAPYINRLYGMVARNITPPFSFTCFTDTTDGVRPEVRTQPLPPLPCEMPVNTPGQWPKSRLWSPALGDLQGPVLFLDLDLVITGSLDPFFEVGQPSDTILARDPARPLHRSGQTSIFRFEIGRLAPIQALFKADPQGIADQYRYEQKFVTQNAPGGVGFWPARWVRHFRIQCVPTFPLNFFRTPALPPDARVILFAGHMNPPDAIAGRWDKGHEHLSPGAHAAWALRSDRPFRNLRHYVRPTPWVAEHWRE